MLQETSHKAANSPLAQVSAKFHFISGLPRAGTTLLAAILRQNPCIHASIQSPVGQCVTDLHRAMSGVNEAHWFITDEQRVRGLRALFSAYYADIKADIVFDTNRRWCANMSLILRLFPDAWVLCCVRDPIAVIDSVERLLQTHPLTLSTIIGLESGTTVFGRVKRLMDPLGLVGYAWNAVQEAYYGSHRDRLLMVNYDDLAQVPDKIMAEIHEKLELPEFEYSFDDIRPIPGAELFDVSIGTPGLHSLKKRVEYVPRQSILPPAILSSLPRAFWLKELQTDA